MPDVESGELESDIQNLRQTMEELVARHSEIEFEITSVKDRLHERERRRQELKEITGELNIGQRFLSTADGLSRTEVVRAMESLNEEIFQLTSIVADQLPVEERMLPESRFRNRVLERSPWLKSMDPYFKVIMSTTLDDPLAIQIGWQAILVQICLATIRAWEVEDLFYRAGELNTTLQAMYQGIQSESKQANKSSWFIYQPLTVRYKDNRAVSGRWRSMVYGVTNDISSEVRGKILDHIVQNLTDLPYVCGYIFTPELFNKIFTSFRERIDPLFDKCLQVRKMVGKDITSTDIQSYYFPPGENYDSTLPADLEHEVEKEGLQKDRKGTIVCSVSLGLYCIHELGGDKEPILKPKVILHNTFKEIIG